MIDTDRARLVIEAVIFGVRAGDRVQAYVAVAGEQPKRKDGMEPIRSFPKGRQSSLSFH